jgi:hypothetical protein
MFDLMAIIVAVILNPLSLLLFLTVKKYFPKVGRKGSNNEWWAHHQGRGA